MYELLQICINGALSLIGIIVTAFVTNSLVKYRLDQLEKKVDKHNSVIERVFVLEQEVKDMKS